MIVGFTGYAGSGKDEAAKALCSLGWERIAFGDAIREVALGFNPIVADDKGHHHMTLRSFVARYGWDDAKRLFSDVRRTLQYTGQTLRNVDEDFWVNIVKRKIAALDKPRVVVPDVRYPNEAEMCDIVIRIVRPGVGLVNDHESEMALDKECYATIVNDGSVDALHRAVQCAVGTRLMTMAIRGGEVLAIRGSAVSPRNVAP